MRVKLIKDCDGPEGLRPSGTVIVDPLAYVLVVAGVAEPLDDEARERAEVELLGQRAADRRNQQAEAEERRESEQERARLREARKNRLRERMLDEAQVLAEFEPETEEEAPDGDSDPRQDSGS